MDKKFRAARVWSNRELKKYAGMFLGSVVNVSAWKDEDKENNYYRDYFLNAESYAITNYGGGRKRGSSEGYARTEEYELDLTLPLSEILFQKFDVVFNHTTLEHVYENRVAFKNLCDMAKDAVIVVVPWVQEVHTIEGGYSDFWRYSPFAMERLYEENGFDMVVCNYNNQKNMSVYLFCIGIRKEQMSKYPQFYKISLENYVPAGRWIGTRYCDLIYNKIRSVCKRAIRGESKK